MIERGLGALAPTFLPDLRAGLVKQQERLLSIPSELAIRGMNLPFSRQSPTLTGDRGRLAPRSANAPILSPAHAAIVDELDRTGVCVTSLDALGLDGTGAMFDDAMALSATLAERALLPATAKKHTLTATASDLLRWKRVIRWGLDERLLDIVETYLGAPAAYDCPLVYRSKADGREESVRVWHRDREDTRMVKVCIYLNDVDEEGGPFQVLTPELQKLVDDRAGWRYAAMKNAGLATKIRDSDWATGVRTITGMRGTVFLADTARAHHRGKPPTARDRSAIFHTYFSRTPRHPFCCERSPLSRRQIAEFAAEMPERERDCLLWRKKLPLLQRLIPRNRLTI